MILPEQLQDYVDKLTIVQLCTVATIATAAIGYCAWWIIINPLHNNIYSQQQELQQLDQNILLSQQQLEHRRIQLAELSAQHELLMHGPLSMNLPALLQETHRLLYQHQENIISVNLEEVKQRAGYWSAPLICKLTTDFSSLVELIGTLQASEQHIAVRELSIAPQERDLAIDIKIKLYSKFVC